MRLGLLETKQNVVVRACVLPVAIFGVCQGSSCELARDWLPCRLHFSDRKYYLIHTLGR